MTMSLTTPVTGGAQTGFTAPTQTLTVDTAPDVNGKQWAVTALGGTQAGVITHSVAAPFTVTVSRPKVFKVLGKPNPVTGLVKDVPMNTYKVIVRKGVLPLAAQPYSVAIFRAEINVPAGSDTADPANLRGAMSLLVGALSQLSAGMGDTAVSGII
jgi:hypothetical protein